MQLRASHLRLLKWWLWLVRAGRRVGARALTGRAELVRRVGPEQLAGPLRAWQLAWAIHTNQLQIGTYLGDHDDEEIALLDRVVLEALVVILKNFPVGDQFLRIGLHLVLLLNKLLGLSDLNSRLC